MKSAGYTLKMDTDAQEDWRTWDIFLLIFFVSSLLYFVLKFVVKLGITLYIEHNKNVLACKIM